jgi:pimeloyl-ACP methyl ester carboxylesterase
MHYQQAGPDRGPQLVLVHGLFSNLAFWYLGAVPRLAQDFRVTAYDLRGHGRSEMPRRGYRTADLAADLTGLLDHLGSERAHVVGHSFGGAVALHFAALHPERVLSVTQADAQIPSLQPALPPRGALPYRRAVARLARDGIAVPPQAPRVAYGFFEELARLRGRSRAALGWSPDSRVQEQWARLMATTSARRELGDAGLTAERISSVERPTLAIFGERSWCMPTLYELERLLRDCRSVVLRGVGHYFPLLQPDRFARELRRFALGEA